MDTEEDGIMGITVIRVSRGTGGSLLPAWIIWQLEQLKRKERKG